MAIRSGINAPAHLVDKYINTAYDTVKSVADNLSTLTSLADFSDVFQEPSGTPPTTRDDGSALQTGDMYFNTNTNLVYIFNDADWQTIVAPSSAHHAYSFVGNGTSKSFSVITITPTSFVTAHIDGVFQSSSSFELYDGLIVFSEAPPLNSEIDITVITAAVVPEPIITPSVDYAQSLATGDGVATEFEVPSAGENKLIICHIDGISQLPSTFTAGLNTVTFTEAPPKNSEITFLVISTGAISQPSAVYPPTLGGLSQTNCALFAGIGEPSGGNPGSIYFRADGIPGNTIYRNTDGLWQAIA